MEITDTMKEELVERVLEFLSDEASPTLLRMEKDDLHPGWHALTWHPPTRERLLAGEYGELYKAFEASPCYSESEYCHKGNYPRTIWAQTVMSSGNKSPDWPLEWDLATREDAKYIGVTMGDFQRLWARLDNAEAVIDLAATMGVVCENQADAEAALLKQDGFYFDLGDPVDGVDMVYFRECIIDEVREAVDYILKMEEQ